ncbi:MAG: NAD-dependent epimerase/dehydratase family protein [Rikenellaceae bacterium]|nr:NAD-dependent epimerase/dehydratase family protein [Rikenellaceae bacterium]
MKILEHNLYKQDLRYVAELPLPWEKLQGATLMISGATGMIGSFIIDVLMLRNREYGQNCRIIALGRNKEKAYNRFGSTLDGNALSFTQYDIQTPIVEDYGTVDFVFHAASNTHPVAYANDPIGTIVANVFGLKYLLDYADKHGVQRFMFASSNEIYGENRGDTDKFSESYCGYIDCNTLRAGYPESKRTGEALCQAYIRQKKMDVVIPRFTRTFGPTMLSSDTKAIAQFLKKGIAGEDIVLKSKGTQYYSYTYVADAASGFFYCLLNGKNGEAYNIADESCDISLKDLAIIIANYTSTKVVFEIPDEIESAGYSTATRAVLDNRKIRELGWRAEYRIRDGIERTISIVKGTS